jgi:hypothetical protein
MDDATCHSNPTITRENSTSYIQELKMYSIKNFDMKLKTNILHEKTRSYLLSQYGQ